MEDSRHILEAVSTGTLAPGEGARLLARLNRRARTAATSGEPSALRIVRLTHLVGDGVIIGDSNIAEVIVEGPHAGHRDGDALEIRAQEIGNGFRFQFDRMPPARTWHDGGPGAVMIRMNPDIALDISSAAGRFNVHGLKGPITADILAGRLQLADVTNCVQLALGSGVLDMSGVITGGVSSLRCEAGLLRLHLRSGSNVRVVARAKLSSVSFPDDDRTEIRPWKPYTTRELLIGQGAGLVTLSAGIGQIMVSADP